MPTYTETLFDPLEAWLDRIEREGRAEGVTDADEAELRLIVSRMLLEHGGRGSLRYLEDQAVLTAARSLEAVPTAELVYELGRRGESP